MSINNPGGGGGAINSIHLVYTEGVELNMEHTYKYVINKYIQRE